MNIFDSIQQIFRQGNSLMKLIFINVVVFTVLKLLVILLLLFNISGGVIFSYLAVPSDLSELLYRALTPITYMFLHEGFLHLLFNMLNLFWFGKIFLMYFSEKQLVGLYLR